MAGFYSLDDRVQFLDVGIDRDDSLYEAWIREHKPNHPVLKDAKRELIKQLGTSGYPSTYVLNCKGEVVYKQTGVWESTQKLRIAIDSALDTLCKEF